MSSYGWVEITVLETLNEIQLKIVPGEVFTPTATQLLIEHIGNAVNERLLEQRSEVRFVTAVEALTAVQIARNQHSRYVDGFIVGEALRANHSPGQPPWTCVTSLLEEKRKRTLLETLEGLRYFA